MEKTKKMKILIPDAHDPLMTGVLQCLSDVKGIKIIALSEEEFIPIRFSRYVSKFYYRPATNDVAQWITSINEIIEENAIDVVFPLFVTAIRNLIAYKDLMVKPELVLLPESLESYDIANNKGLLSDFLWKLGLPVPKFWHIDPKKPLENISEIDVFPVLLKPTLDSGAGRGIIKFENASSLLEYLSSTPVTTPHFLQESIDGYDMGCHVLCKDGDILAVAMQEGFLFSKKPFTPQAGMNMIHEEAVYDQVKKLMKALNWNGLADLDLRYDNKTGNFMIIEINPRAWFTILGPATAGVNFPWLYCKAAIGLPFDKPECSKTPFYTRLGLRLAIARNPVLLLRPKYILKYTPLRYIFKDPIMYKFEFFKIFKKVLREKFKGNKSKGNSNSKLNLLSAS